MVQIKKSPQIAKPDIRSRAEALRARVAKTGSDPVFAVIDKARRLEAADARLFAKGNDGDATPAQTAGTRRLMIHVHDVLLATVPTTGRGCAELALFVLEFHARWGLDIDAEASARIALCDLLKRSPKL